MTWGTLSNILALFVIFFFAFRGYRQGFFSALLSLLAVFLGYLAAFKWSVTWGEMIAQWGLAQGLLAYAVGGMAAFFIIQAVFSVPAWLLYRHYRKRAREGQLAPVYWSLGGAMGLVSGLFYAFLIVWAVMLFRASRDVPAERPSASQRVASHAVYTVSRKVLKPAAPVAGKPGLGDLTLKLMAQPQKSIRGLKQIVDNPKLEFLLQNPSFQNKLADSKIELVAADPLLQDLLNDEDFNRALLDLGLEDSMVDRRTLSREFARTLVSVFDEVSRLKTSPEALAILTDPKVQELLQKRDVVKLLSHPDFARLVSLMVDRTQKQVVPLNAEKIRPWFRFVAAGENQWDFIVEGLRAHPDLNLAYSELLKDTAPRIFSFPQDRGIARDDFKALEKLASRGHASAQYRLAMKLANGWWAPYQPKRARQLMHEAAKKNFPEAQYHWGAMLISGWAGEVEMAPGVFWILKSARQGLAEAHYALGLIYSLGLYDQSVDAKLAAQGFLQAGQKGHSRGQFFLAFCYYLGRGLEKNGQSAYQWALLAQHGRINTAEAVEEIFKEGLTLDQVEMARHQANALLKTP